MSAKDYMTDGSTTSDFDAREILGALIRRKWVIVAVAAPIIFMVTFGTLRSASSVVASTRVLVEPNQPENPSFDRRYVNEDALMSTVAQIAMSIPVARMAAESLIDSIPLLREMYPEEVFPSSKERLVDILLGGIDTGRVGNSTILTVSVSNRNQRMALMAVADMTDAFIQFSVQRMQNTGAIKYYAEQMNTVMAEIDSLMDLRVEIMDRSGIYSFTENPNTSVTQIRFLESEYFQARSKRVGVQRHLEGLLTTIEANPDFVPDDDYMHPTKFRLNDLNDALSRLQAKYSDSSEWVKRQKQLIEKAQADLYRDRANYISTLELQLEEAIGVENSLRESLESQYSSISQYPQFAKEVNSIDMQVASRRDLLESLQFKRGEVRLKSSSDARISNIIQLDEPFVRSNVGGSKKLLYIGVATLFALIMGVVAAIFIDTRDSRLLNRRRAEKFLDVPVLGSISSLREDDAR